MKKALKISLFSLLFFLPGYLLKIPLGKNSSLPFLDLLLLAFIVLSFAKIKTLYSFQEIKQKTKTTLVFAVLLIFFTFVSSYIFNFQRNNWSDGLGAIKSFLFLPCLAGLSFSLLLSKKILSVKNLAVPIFLSTSALSLLGYFWGLKNYLTYDGRLKLFFESPNQLAMLLSIGVICGVYLFLTNKTTLNHSRNILFPKSEKFNSFFILLALFSHIFSLFLTRSLGSAIGLLFVFLLLLGVNFFPRISFGKTLLGAVFLFSSFIFFIAISPLKISHQQKIPPSSIDSRIAIYKASGKIFSNNWLWGVGPAKFQNSYLDYQKFFPPYPQWAVPHAHNNLLHFAIEGGIFPLLGLGLVIFLVSQEKKQTPQGLFVLAVLGYFLIHGTVDVTIWKNDLSTIFWLFVFTSKTQDF